MAVRMPVMSVRALPRTAREVSDVLEQEVSRGRIADGWVRVERPISDSFLFVHKGKAHSAGALTADGRFEPRTFPQFFASLDGNNPAELCATDGALLLCAAVPFRKAPALSMVAAGLGLDVLLEALREIESDSVLVARSGDAVSLAFCHKGVPVQLFPARGETFPHAAQIAERITLYAAAHPDLVLTVYADVRLGPAAGAGEPFASYLRGGNTTGAPASLVIKLGGRIVFRHELGDEAAEIGRGSACAIPLDNLSVSRRHARVRRSGAKLLFEDLGSENGILLDGKKVARAEIAAGGEVVLGKYTLLFAPPGSDEEKVALAKPAPAGGGRGSDLHQTILVGSSSTRPAARFELDGASHVFKGLVFTIGSAPESHLRIGGLFVAREHARVLRDPQGRHLLTHVGGLRAMTVNGVRMKEAVLEDGAVIGIAGRKIVFRHPPETAAAAATTGIGPKRTS